MKSTNYAKMIGGKKVVNGTRKVKLHISAADTKASRKTPKPVWRPRRVTTSPNCVAARVHVGRVYLLKKDGQWHRYKTQKPCGPKS